MEVGESLCPGAPAVLCERRPDREPFLSHGTDTTAVSGMKHEVSQHWEVASHMVGCLLVLHAEMAVMADLLAVRALRE